MPATREVIERERVHRATRRCARGDLHDGRAEPHPLGGRTPPRERSERVGPPRFGGEDGVESFGLGRSNEFRCVRGWLGTPVTELQSQFHWTPFLSDESRRGAVRAPLLPATLEPVLLEFVSLGKSAVAEPPLSAPLNLKFDYTRSTGPTVGAFVTGLRDGRILGARGSDGRVLVPPPEFDAVTHEPLTDFVEVGQTGTVVSWTWNAEPLPGQPFDRPFAWALIRLDGATRRCCTRSTSRPRTRSRRACVCACAGRPSARA